MLQTELRRGAAEGRGEPCTQCIGSPDWCAHHGELSVKLWWSWGDGISRICGPSTSDEHWSMDQHGSVRLPTQAAQAEFERRNLELLGRAE